MTARSRGALARKLTGAASVAALIAAISAVAPALAQDFSFDEVAVEVPILGIAARGPQD